MIKIDLKIDPLSLKSVRRYPKLLDEGLLAGMKKAMFFTEAEVKKSFGTPGKPKVQTGHLRRSIKSDVLKKSGNKVQGSVSSNTKYSRIQETGGVIKAKSSGGYLMFKIGNEFKKVKQVTIPARPYLRPGIEDNINHINDIITDSIINTYSGRK